MKVILLNGSPHAKGCTYTALTEVAGALQKNDINTEIIHLGAQPIPGCMACGTCKKTGKCIVDDEVNELSKKVPTCDGFVFGTPVHYAAVSSSLTSFLDRLFYSNSQLFRGKLGAAVVSCRRGGSSTAFDQINKYFTISGMPIVSSQYWNQVHGNNPAEVMEDKEGLQTMRTLGNNMAWLLKCIAAGREKGLVYPLGEDRIRTNFIRP